MANKKIRYYRKWAGNSAGSREKPDQCIAEVADGGHSVLSHQCYNARHHADGLCGVHHRRKESGGYVRIPEEE